MCSIAEIILHYRYCGSKPIYPITGPRLLNLCPSGYNYTRLTPKREVQANSTGVLKVKTIAIH